MLGKKEKRELSQLVLLLTEELARVNDAGSDISLDFYAKSEKVTLSVASNSATLTVANKGQITWDYKYMMEQSGTPQAFLAERIRESV